MSSAKVRILNQVTVFEIWVELRGRLDWFSTVQHHKNRWKLGISNCIIEQKQATYDSTWLMTMKEDTQLHQHSTLHMLGERILKLHGYGAGEKRC